jgi:murein DD-endopeptidase MepM/ murein hydrolase activator NlpD
MHQAKTLTLVLILTLALAGNPAVGGTVTLKGSISQGGLIEGHTQPGAKVTLDGRPVQVSAKGVFLIGFSRDATPQARLLVTFSDGSHESRMLKVTQREYHIQRISGLPARMVTPKEKDLPRIYAEIALIRKTHSRDDARTDFLTGFIWPTVGRISGVYGSQRILNGKPRQPHLGVDIAAPVGTPIVAPADGVVTLAYANMYFTGDSLIVDHGQGLASSFFHLSRILVKEGQHVRQGEPIAEVGKTGRVTGPHLHWSVNLFDRSLDPQLIMQSVLARTPSSRPQMEASEATEGLPAGGDDSLATKR